VVWHTVGGRDGATATLTVRTAVGAVLGHVTLTYETDVTGDVIQLYGRQLDTVCSSMFDNSLTTPPLLDALLSGSVFDDAGHPDHHLSPRTFELLFESAKHVASGRWFSSSLLRHRRCGRDQ